MTKRTKLTRTTRSVSATQLAAAVGGINAQTPADWNERKIFNDIFISTVIGLKA